MPGIESEVEILLIC